MDIYKCEYKVLESKDIKWETPSDYATHIGYTEEGMYKLQFHNAHSSIISVSEEFLNENFTKCNLK